MNSILAASIGGITALIIKPRLMAKENERINMYDPTAVINGILAGLVSVTAPCNNIEPWCALIIGSLGGATYSLACKLEHKLKIDDPIEAS